MIVVAKLITPYPDDAWNLSAHDSLVLIIWMITVSNKKWDKRTIKDMQKKTYPHKNYGVKLSIHDFIQRWFN